MSAVQSDGKSKEKGVAPYWESDQEWYQTQSAKTMIQSMWQPVPFRGLCDPSVLTIGATLVCEPKIPQKELSTPLKIVLIGKSGSGKTSTCCHFSGRDVPETHLETIGMQIYDCIWPFKVRNGRIWHVPIQLWDVGASHYQKFSYMNAEMMREVSVVAYVCSASDYSSFQYIEAKMQEQVDVKCTKAIIVTRNEVWDNRQVTLSDLQALSEKHNAIVFPVCNTGVSPTSAPTEDAQTFLTAMCLSFLRTRNQR